MPAALSPATHAALREGIARFDAGRWFDAHEVWEDAWRHESGGVRQLLQGLIQIAAGFHKGLVQEVPAGMVRLLRSGLSHLGGVEPHGLPLEPFRAGVERWRSAAERWASGGPRPELPVPRLGAGDEPGSPRR